MFGYPNRSAPIGAANVEMLAPPAFPELCSQDCWHIAAYAAQHNRLELLRYVLDAGRLNPANNIAFLAASNGHVGIVDFLLKAYPPRLDARQSVDSESWAGAIASNQLTVVDHLIELGATPEPRTRFAMNSIVQRGRIEILKKVLRANVLSTEEHAWLGREARSELATCRRLAGAPTVEIPPEVSLGVLEQMNALLSEAPVPDLARLDQFDLSLQP